MLLFFNVPTWFMLLNLIFRTIYKLMRIDAIWK